jgi:hypothetical protein
METTPPGKSKGREIVERTIEVGLNFVPGVGGALAVAFVSAVSWQLNQRREEWLSELAEAVEDLRERIGDASFETLAENSLFVDAVVTTTRAIDHTHQEEKIAALRNAVLNSVAPDAPDADTQAMFLNLVEQFTPSHLRLLTMWNDPGAWFALHGLTPPAGALAGAMAEVVEAGLPEMKGRQEFYGLVVADLNASGLFAAELSGLLGAAALMRPLTNRIGRQFVEFISPPA